MSPASDPKIQVSVTPNPQAMKFTLDRQILQAGSRSFSGKFDALDDPLGKAIFDIPGVAGLFYMANFVTVTKEAGAAWEGIVRSVEDAIRDHMGRA